MLVLIPSEIWLAAVLGTRDADRAFLIELLFSLLVVGGAYLAALALDLRLPFVWLVLPAAALACLPLSYARVRGLAHGDFKAGAG
jgi:hypothetical protein